MSNKNHTIVSGSAVTSRAKTETQSKGILAEGVEKQTEKSIAQKSKQESE